MWYQATSWGSSGSFKMLFELTADGNSNVGGLTCYVENNAVGLTYGMRGDVGTNSGNIQAAPALNVWQHLAVVFDFTAPSPEGTIYIDGLQLTITIAALANNNNSSASRFANSVLSIGCRNQGVSLPFQGQMDDIRLYNRALAPSEIATLALRRGIAYETSPTRRYFIPAAVSSTQRRRMTQRSIQGAF